MHLRSIARINGCSFIDTYKLRFIARGEAELSILSMVFIHKFQNNCTRKCAMTATYCNLSKIGPPSKISPLS